jgi:glycosyltransferase involved in cell wall biosynthesis
MNKSILVISTQYPGYGGASTNAYAIIKYLRKQNYNVVGIFVEDKNINVDPDNIGNIFRFAYYPFVQKINSKIAEYKILLDNLLKEPPNIILCKNYIAPLCSKMLYPNVKNIYLVSGLCCVIDICEKIPANKLVSQKICLKKNRNEIMAIDNSDIIVTNSPLTLDIFLNSFIEYKQKIYPIPVDTTKYATLLINNINNTNNAIQKKFDFIITSSILTRKEKNNIFMIDILNKPEFNKYTKLIIGSNNASFLNIPNSKVFDLLPHSKLMELMANTKVLLYPSLYDSNPNTIREAVHNKCLVLMSNNIGYHELFPNISVCSTYDQKEWISKSIYLVDNYEKIIKNYCINFNTDDILLQLIEKLVQ